MTTPSERERWGLPRQTDLTTLMGERDPLRVVVRGWQWVENLLVLALADRLPVSADHVELDRVNTRLRIDLCAGMGAFPLEDHGSFVRLNTLRNHFVHKQKTKLARQDGIDLANTWSPRIRSAAGAMGVNRRSSAVGILRTTLVLHILNLQIGIEERRDAAIQEELFWARFNKLRERNAPRGEHYEAEFERRKRDRRRQGKI